MNIHPDIQRFREACGGSKDHECYVGLEILDPAGLARRIEETRQARGLSLACLARQSGIKLTVLCRLETGQARPARQTLRRLAQALGVSERWLLGGSA